MKNYISILFIVLMGFSAFAQNSQQNHKAATNKALTNSTNTAHDVPLIDREIFFGNPSIASGQLSPDGQYVSFMKEHEGIMNLWVKSFSDDFEDAKLLTASKSPILGYMWSLDSKYMLFVNDKGGNENMNIFAVDPRAAGDKVPEARNLTPLEDVTAQLISVSKKDPDLLMVGLNDRDKAWHDLYSLKISTGELNKVFENDNRYTSYEFDWDENLRLASRTDEDGNSQLLRIDPDGTFKEIYSTNIKEQAYISSWTPDNKEAYIVSNKGDINFSTLYKLNPETGGLTIVESDPKKKVDFGGLWVNDETREIISTSYTYDKRERYFKDPKWKNIYAHLKSKFPDREVGFNSFTKDYSKMLVSVSGDKYASEVYFYDSATKDLILQYTPRPELKEVEKYLSTMKPINYKSSDGLTIPGYLTIPSGATTKNLPTVILVHGGPKGPRDTWRYNSYAQFLSNRGYAVMQPNFRASGGYGKEFMNAGDKQWGKLMQDDITWGVKYLIDQGISDPNKIAIMGGSYGGYATLAGLAFTPDVYACGIDIVGPSNLFTLLESIPAYWESGRKWLYEMVGDPETEEGQKLLTEASPLFSVDNITKPLLIIQGANDPRVKKAESDQIVIALRDKGHPVDYLLADDEGHGFRKPLNRMAMFAQAEKFLATHIGGRYQPEIPDDVSETLAKITVDINTVVHKPKDNSIAAAALPEINYDWKESSEDYDIELDLGGQKMPMQMTRTIAKEGENWTVSDVINSPMGEMTDKVFYNSNFEVQKQESAQAGQTLSMTFAKNQVNLNMAGKEKAIDTEGIVISNGAGMDVLLSTLDLKEGEKFTFNAADAMKMKSNKYIATHQGATTMDGKSCYQIDVVNTDDEKDKISIWYNQATNECLKYKQVIPAMGGATMTMTKKQ